MPRLTRRSVGGLLLMLFGAGSLAACGDEADEPQRKVVSVSRPAQLPKWLTVKDVIEPSLWLRSREIGRLVLPSDPEVDRLRRAMHQATLRFFEDQRMIANRTAQTADMLAEAQQPERYVDIMTGMVDVADATVSKKAYGDMVQHYLNLRKEGMDRTAALNSLTASYKAENSSK